MPSAINVSRLWVDGLPGTVAVSRQEPTKPLLVAMGVLSCAMVWKGPKPSPRDVTSIITRNAMTSEYGAWRFSFHDKMQEQPGLSIKHGAAGCA